MKAEGAAIASFMAESTITVMYLYMARDYFEITCIPKILWKRIIGAGSMLAVVILIRQYINHQAVLIVVQITVGAAVYGISLLVLKDEFLIKNIKKILKKA